MLVDLQSALPGVPSFPAVERREADRHRIEVTYQQGRLQSRVERARQARARAIAEQEHARDVQARLGGAIVAAQARIEDAARLNAATIATVLAQAEEEAARIVAEGRREAEAIRACLPERAAEPGDHLGLVLDIVDDPTDAVAV